ncbi:MAG: proline--tRNA ligase [Campylobacterales bacterium]
MRFSRAFVPTEKETPKDAVLISHKYLLRGGFISQLSAGIYDFMPLGKRVLDKVRAVVKEELDNAGCQEVSLGFVTPADLWKESDRYHKYGKELLRFYDRKTQEFVLGPTHEEVMVNMVRGRAGSYKQLPLNLYQINLKFRDEARPRFGLMRGREFLMKDGYSFHATTEDMLREFHLMEETYKKIFRRTGLDFRVVEADSGAIGGSGSKEFMVLADAGEDTIVVCEQCEYGANIEAAKRKPKTYGKTADGRSGEVATPGKTAIDEVAAFLNLPTHRLIKAVVKKALYNDREQLCVFYVRGCDELEETKALNAVGANDLIDAEAEEMEHHGIVAGFIGLGYTHPHVIRVVDQELRGESGMVTGADKKDFHRLGVSVSDELRFADLIAVQAGDSCPVCGGKLGHTPGIEVGHIFQLGERYSKPLNANFLDENGKAKPYVMGTYGIGVSRLVAAAIEQHHDEKGCKWPIAIAPYAVDLIAGNLKDEAQKVLAESLYDQLQRAGIEVIFDDRPAGFGVKMNDYELIGFPFALIAGKKAAEGIVEIAVRESGERLVMPAAEAIQWLEARCRLS